MPPGRPIAFASYLSRAGPTSPRRENFSAHRRNCTESGGYFPKPPRILLEGGEEIHETFPFSAIEITRTCKK
jgi:hypothetical protein